MRGPSYYIEVEKLAEHDFSHRPSTAAVEGAFTIRGVAIGRALTRDFALRYRLRARCPPGNSYNNLQIGVVSIRWHRHAIITQSKPAAKGFGWRSILGQLKPGQGDEAFGAETE
jgi:hypothetical protein